MGTAGSPLGLGATARIGGSSPTSGKIDMVKGVVGSTGVNGGGKAAGEVGTPVTSGGTANAASAKGLTNDLAIAQAGDPLIGTILPGGKAPVTVTAESNIGGITLVDTNQTARPVARANPNQPTLIADLLPPGAPNSTMANAHAEIGLIQQGYNAGLTQGNSMTIVVRGERFCDYCRSSDNVIAAAERAGLNNLTIVDTANPSGLTYWTWTRPKPGETSTGWIKSKP